MNSISPSLQILRSAVLAWSVFSTQASAEQPTDEDKALLEIFQADPKAPAAETAPAKVASIVEKWTDYEKTQIDTLNRTISAARNIAWEILSKKALAAPAASRETLLKELVDMKVLTPDASLCAMNGKDEAHYKELLGVWRVKDTEWTHDTLPLGKVIYSPDTIAQWHWIDPDAGVIGCTNQASGGSVLCDLCWIEKKGSMRLINRDAYRLVLLKDPGPPPPPIDPTILKLHEEETAQRLELNKTLTAKRSKVLAWLLGQTKKASPAEAPQLLEDLRKMEASADEQTDFASKLAGVWQWDRTKMIFQAGGILASPDGRKCGRWGWVDSTRAHFAVVLKGGKSGADIYLANAPKDALQLTLGAQRLVGGRISVTRTLP